MRIRAIEVVLLAGPGIAACFAVTSAADPASGPEPRLSVRVEVSCEATVPAYCQGRFGFSVGGDGVWRAGPRPDGQVVSGRLPAAEARRLDAAARGALRAAEQAAPACPVLGPIPGVGERVTVAARDRTLVLNGAGGQLDPRCSPHLAEYAALFGLADELMRRYYPRPF